METFSHFSRRGLLLGAAALSVAGYPRLSLAASPARCRAIVDNDFSGDPDGLFALAHLLLSPSVTVPLVVGSHIHTNDYPDNSPTQADNAVALVRQLLAILKLPSPPALAAGLNAAPRWQAAGPAPGAAAHAIAAEAMRNDSRPLYYTAGAGLTELALALRLEPRIASRMTLIWIGGAEQPDSAALVPPRTEPEYNLTIDADAAKIVFNESDIAIWQIPRDVYRQMIVSLAELRAELAAAGSLGMFLADRLRVVKAGIDPAMGETYVLGDSPLVTLSALTTPWQPDSASSSCVMKPTPRLGSDGSYGFRADGRPMRIYRTIDTRLTFADMAAKFAAFGRRENNAL